jgi:sterol desaturase/sphingolipid hydroxylase (fatty acid hydroxylase superfamily)
MTHEFSIRLYSYLAIFIVMALWEWCTPRRPLHVSKGRRWFMNLAISIIDTALVRVLFPVAAVGAALFAADNGWGLFNYVSTSSVVAIVASFVLLDAVIYLQHIIFHAIPILWRFHMVHHADLDLDASSGLRFHPFEILISMIIKIAAITLIGPPPLAVLIFEVGLNGTAIFNHSNVRIPQPIDRFLRLFLVTPDMHRVHHSIDTEESNSNFGFNLPWWDYLCGTYRAQPRAGHEAMTIGLKQYREDQRQGLAWLILLPFMGRMGAYAINRRHRGPDE